MSEAYSADQQAVTRMRQLLRLVAECHLLGIAPDDEAKLCQQFCQTLVQLGGYASAAIGLRQDQGDMCLIAASMASGEAPQLWSELTRGGSLHYEKPLRSGNQNLGALHITFHAAEDLDDDERYALCQVALGLAATLNLMRTEARHSEMGLQLRQLSRALESSSNGVMITSSTHLDHPIVYVNAAFERITGYKAEEVIGSNGRFLVREDLNQRGLNEIRTALRDRRDGHAIVRNYRKDGELFWNELFISPVRDESGHITTHFVSIINDVTARVTYEQQLEYHATHDTLTGLANRSLLHDRIDQAILHARHDQRMVGVLLLDLDRFKLINDGFGHMAADSLLKQVAERLATCVRDTDTVARLGGDEFVVVVADVEDADDVAVVAAKIMRALAQPTLLEGKELFVTASVGASLFPRDGEHGEALLRSADMAMYRVKEHGRNSYRFYAPEMNQMALDRLDMEGNLRRALERNELTAFYQPIVNIKSGKIIGAEALVRWNHPRIGMIHPPEFIPLAEETGLIIPLGEQVLAQVLSQIASWQNEGLPALRVAVNISARQFRQENLASHVEALLTRAGINGSTLEFELTESMVMHDVENAITTMRELKALGIELSLDDFGTGYSSLSYLKRFPIDTLKIDRSFVRDIIDSADDAAIARAVIAMAHSLDLRVIAEGVESEHQIDLLERYECDALQGYYFSRPVPHEEFTLMLRHDKRLRPSPELPT